LVTAHYIAVIPVQQWSRAMQIGDRSTDNNVPAQHPHALVRWIAGCAVIAAMLAAGLGAVAIAGGNGGRSEQAVVAEPGEHKPADKPLERSGNFFSYDIVY
jgi:hypothetical protein